MSNTIYTSKTAVTGKEEYLYEGEGAYVFISYSHLDTAHMTEVRDLFRKNNIRLWYDNGLHSGDDWNFVIAEHLEKASVCLLLLSPNSASSQYVKNELNFAINHRVPIHILLLEEFPLPIDIEIMVGRIQMVSKTDGYERRLLESLPGELYDDAASFVDPKESGEKEHPLFRADREILNRQGTVSYIGNHKTLGYELLILEENIVNASPDAVKEQAKGVSRLSHPLFPKIYDVTFEGNRMWTYQEYRGEVFLDQYLSEHKLQEAEILEWMNLVIDAMEYLYSLNYGFRDFARGSLVVQKNGKIGMFRLQNPYYGVFRLQADNKQYYFEKEVQEIAALLYQLCTGEVPVLPFRMISENSFSKGFLNKVNLILQKSARERGRIRYERFSEIKEDLNAKDIGFRELRFLTQRRDKLRQYEKAKEENAYRFTSGEGVSIRKENLEEEFGLEATVSLAEAEVENAAIRILVCSTGQLLEFSKQTIIIGRAPECDMALMQPSLSRMHTRISKESEDAYLVEDLGATNGTFVTAADQRVLPGEKVKVAKGETIRLGRVELQLM